MKKKIIFIAASGIVLFLMTSGVMDSTGKLGYTQSPGETNCNQSGCHTGNAINASGGSITITAPALNGWQYTPGQVYTINVTVARTTQSRFGFDFEALTASGANAGTITVTNTTLTRKGNANVLGNSRANITHTGSGNTGAGTFTFSFNWTAPATNIGNVTFYAAGNAANNNGTQSGDFIYTTSQSVASLPVNGINDKAVSIMNVSVYPNPVTELTTVSYELIENANMSARLISLSGQTVITFYNEKEAPGFQEKKLMIPSSISKGIYLIVLDVNENHTYKKIVIE